MRVTLWLDAGVLDGFKARAHAAGGGSYRARVEAALRRQLEPAATSLETTLRRIVREELERASR